MMSCRGRLAAITGVWACGRGPPLWVSHGTNTQVKTIVKIKGGSTQWLGQAMRWLLCLVRELAGVKSCLTSHPLFYHLDGKAIYRLMIKMIYVSHSVKSKTQADSHYTHSTWNHKTKTSIIQRKKRDTMRLRKNFNKTDKAKGQLKT